MKNHTRLHELIWNLSEQVLTKNPEQCPVVQQDEVKLVRPQSCPPGCLKQQSSNDSRNFRPERVGPCWLLGTW